MSLKAFTADLFKPNLDEDAFFRAVQNRDEKYVAKILKFYPAVSNRLDAKGRSPLNIAVDTHNVEISTLLIAAGASLEHIDPNMGMQPLNRALWTGYADLAELLIDKGADVNARDHNGNSKGGNNPGQTPLYHAVSECPVEILKKLVAKGAKVNVYCDDNTPLTLAAMSDNQRDNSANIKYLISAGADIGMAKPSNGVTADQLAYQGPSVDYLKEVKRKYDIDEAARAKAKADMDAIRAAEQQKLQEKADAVEAIDSLTSGAKNNVKVGRPLRLVRNGQP